MNGIYTNTKFKINIVILSVIMGLIFSAGYMKTVNAKENISISNNSLRLYTNMSKEIKIQGAKKKVKWSSSNSKIAMVLGTRGKNDQIATIKTKGKKGKCKIKAIVDGKTYSCTIKVKNDSKVSRVKLVKCEKADDSVTVEVKLNNKTKKNIEYGKGYVIEKFVNGSWKKVDLENDIIVNSVAINIPAKSAVIEKYTIARREDIDKFTKGTYRLTIDICQKDMYNYVLFTLK